jgi:hypothetical protein
MASEQLTFDAMVELWQSCYRAARGGGDDVPDVRKTADFIQKKTTSAQVFECLRPLGDSFLNLVLGLSSGNIGAERVVRSVLCFFPKFFNVDSVSQLPDLTANQLNHACQEMYFLGLTSHLILFNHPSRNRIELLNRDNLYSKFLEVAGMADAKMRAYNKDSNGIPEAVFLVQFKTVIEPVLKHDIKIGHWEMGKLRSHFRNIYFAGTILGMLADIQAAET